MSQAPQVANTLPVHLPLHLNGQSPAWQKWRDSRLYQQSQPDPGYYTIEPGNAGLAETDICGLGADLRQRGYALFKIDDRIDQRQSLSGLLAQLGLRANDEGVIRADDGLSLLRDHGDGPRARFVPYSNRLLNWHTDGYYNAADQTLRCFVLHCLQPAASGGELMLLDPELLLIELYREAAESVSLLSHPECICLPANTDQHGHSRPDRYAAVFSAHADGTLAMRYTTRSRNIRFRNRETEQAMQQLRDIIDRCEKWHVKLRLEAGQGILCRNLLHCRSSFTDPPDQPGRQILRGRFTHLPASAMDQP